MPDGGGNSKYLCKRGSLASLRGPAPRKAVLEWSGSGVSEGLFRGFIRVVDNPIRFSILINIIGSPIYT